MVIAVQVLVVCRIAGAQLARFYDLPSFGVGGGVESKVPDAEAAAEAMQTILMVGLAGMTLCQSLGTLSFGMYGSPEMAVICDEMVHMVKRILAGFTVDEDTMAVDVIRQVGHGGNYLDVDHTVRYFRKELFFPSLFRRYSIDEWVKAGSKSIDQVAHGKVLSILEKATPVDLPPGADAELERALQRALASRPAFPPAPLRRWLRWLSA